MARPLALLLLACLPLPALAQGADDPGYMLVDGIGACLLGGGDLATAQAELDRLGWTSEADADGTVRFHPAAGEAVTGSISADGKTCVLESAELDTGDADMMFNLFMMGGNSGIEVTEEGTDAMGCPTRALSNGGMATLTSAGDAPTCESDDTARVAIVYGAS